MKTRKMVGNKLEEISTGVRGDVSLRFDREMVNKIAKKGLLQTASQ